MKRLIVLALMVTIGLGGLAIETVSAQNSNSSTTMGTHDNMSKPGRHHRRRHHRRHSRHRRHTANKNSNR